MNKTATVTPDKMQKLAEEIGDIREVLDLATDFIDFTPSVENERVQANPLYSLQRGRVGRTKRVSK